MNWRDEVRKHLSEEYPWGAVDGDFLIVKFTQRPHYDHNDDLWEGGEGWIETGNYLPDAPSGHRQLVALDNLHLTQFSLHDLQRWDCRKDWYEQIYSALSDENGLINCDEYNAIDASWTRLICGAKCEQWILEQLNREYGE